MINKMFFAVLPFMLCSCIAPLSDKGISGSMSDGQINSIISAKIHQKSSKAFAQIDIDVHMGDVLLTGFIDDVSIGVEAEKMAWKTDGVRSVYNHIQNCMEASLLDYTKDMWITTRIKSQFAANKNIKSLNYMVKTVAGSVYVLGISQSENEIKEVHDTAKKTSDVKKVISYVKLKQNTY